MTDLSGLTPDQLAEKVIRLAPPDPGSFGGHDYSPKERELGYGTWRDPRFAQCRALSELVRRASERDQAVKDAELTAAGHREIVRVCEAARDQAVRERDSWQEVAEVYKTSTAAYRRDADEAVERADRLAAALAFYAQQRGLGARLASDGGKIARDALTASQETTRMSAASGMLSYRVSFECGHAAVLLGDEYGDGSAWCQQCGAFQTYDRCPHCGMLNCDHARVLCVNCKNEKGEN